MHRCALEVHERALELGRDTLESWQSEFLQLIWQVAGLTYLLYVGSPQSKEEDDRLEEKLDAILRSVHPANAERLIRSLDEKWPGRHVGSLCTIRVASRRVTSRRGSGVPRVIGLNDAPRLPHNRASFPPGACR